MLCKRRRKFIGRPREETELRVFLGVTLRARTGRQLRRWAQEGRRRDPRYNPGRCLDELTAFAISRGFIPRSEQNS